MRSGDASTHARILRRFHRIAAEAREAGLSRIRVEDDVLRGDIVTVGGRPLVNFGSCAYLGLNLHPDLKDGAVRAIDRYGPVFSSSTAYTSVPLYSQLEESLEEIVGLPVVVPPTTTLGHLAAIPVLVGVGDAIVVDAQAHSSVHLAVQQVSGQGIPVRVVAHNDMPALDHALEDLCEVHDKVWYLADGVYSMQGDVLPSSDLVERLDRFPNLWAYIDDAHGFGWRGEHGRGLVLDEIGPHDRVIVAASLAKSFGSGGAVIVFPERELADRVQLTGGTLTFSGPVHPAELGAAVASAEIHLSDLHRELVSRLMEQIDLMRETITRLQLPVATLDRTPIWFMRVGGGDDAVEVARRMMKDGFYLNLARFPAVPINENGLRFTNTLYQSHDQIVSMLEALGANLDEVTGGIDVSVDLTAEPAYETTSS